MSTLKLPKYFLEYYWNIHTDAWGFLVRLSLKYTQYHAVELTETYGPRLRTANLDYAGNSKQASRYFSAVPAELFFLEVI